YGTLGGASRRRWRELFARAPGFRCSDPYLEVCYWYRWYGLWLNAVAAGSGGFENPGMCAGIGELHHPAASATRGHARELRWLADPEYARGVLRTFFRLQREDGSIPAEVLAAGVGREAHTSRPGFADWGDALLAVDAVSGDDAFVADMYPRLERYAQWLLRAGDSMDSGLFGDAGRTPRGDGAEDRAVDRSVTCTVDAHGVLRALERLAKRAGAESDGSRWSELATRTARAVRERMWDARREMFFDLDAQSGNRRSTKVVSSFFPYATDIATAEHLGGLEHVLLDPEQFWTTFPAPLLAVDDARFDPFADRSDGSTAIGRVQPGTNSRIVDALARASLAYAPHLRPVVAQFIVRFVRMMFHEGDPHRANCHEHYNPFSGHASVHLGSDDQQTSWINDLIIQYIVGVRPHSQGITIDPFPSGLELVELTRLRVRSHALDIRIEGDRFRVDVDGKTRDGSVGSPMQVGG
ncbi:MAG: MGH1-like glycoside hydrolase domain-containing protein, partial [Gemmatimonadaceae bacterium]